MKTITIKVSEPVSKGWRARHQLGRKRLLDTLLAATFHHAGVRRMVTNNERDFRELGVFKIVTFGP